MSDTNVRIPHAVDLQRYRFRGEKHGRRGLAVDVSVPADLSVDVQIAIRAEYDAGYAIGARWRLAQLASPSNRFRAYVAAAGKYGWARDQRSALNPARRGIAVQLDGEGDRVDFWHESQIERVAEAA